MNTYEEGMLAGAGLMLALALGIGGFYLLIRNAIRGYNKPPALTPISQTHKSMTSQENIAK